MSINHCDVLNPLVAARVIHEAGYRLQLFDNDGACDREGFLGWMLLMRRLSILQVLVFTAGFVLTNPFRFSFGVSSMRRTGCIVYCAVNGQVKILVGSCGCVRKHDGLHTRDIYSILICIDFGLKARNYYSIPDTCKEDLH